VGTENTQMVNVFAITVGMAANVRPKLANARYRIAAAMETASPENGMIDLN
jgi:hypothetical protein